MTSLQQELLRRVRELEELADERAAELLHMATRAAHAEGEVKSLRDALADLATRLDVATAEARKRGGGGSDSQGLVAVEEGYAPCHHERVA
jgi:hypothetical protein